MDFRNIHMGLQWMQQGALIEIACLLLYLSEVEEDRNRSKIWERRHPTRLCGEPSASPVKRGDAADEWSCDGL
jgi:hypothetical protein